MGDHNYGTPDRQAGLHLSGALADKLITWGAGAVLAAQDPDNKKLDFESTVDIDNGDDFSEGPMLGGRIDFHPLGYLKKSQGDFSGEPKVTLGFGGFFWKNDDDNLTPIEIVDGAPVLGKQHVDQVYGLEFSGAIRGGGFSVDAQYNMFESELVEDGITDGLYEDSETTLENFAVEGGYMLIPKTLEVVGGFQMQDADNYADEWTRVSFGANYFIHKHDTKLQVTYRIGENKDGKEGKDVDELFVQAQYVF